MEVSKIETLKVGTESNTYEFMPATKTWQELTDYVNTLSNFRAREIIFNQDQKKFVKSPSKQYIEVKHTYAEAPIIVDIGKKVSEESREHAVVVRGNDYPFLLKESDISKYFEGFDKIMSAEPADAPVDARVEAEAAEEVETSES